MKPARRHKMPQVKLNKSSLSLEQKNLKNYKQFLPSLDLKRQKLLIEKNKADHDLQSAQHHLKQLEARLGANYPMAAVAELNLDNLLTIESVLIEHQNIVGVTVPILKEIKFNRLPYAYFNTPHWLDSFREDLITVIQLKISLQLGNEQVDALNRALQVVTQRKNLFEKVLIPRSSSRIRTIQIFLSDNERAAVVRSKIAKKKRQVE